MEKISYNNRFKTIEDCPIVDRHPCGYWEQVNESELFNPKKGGVIPSDRQIKCNGCINDDLIRNFKRALFLWMTDHTLNSTVYRET